MLRFLASIIPENELGAAINGIIVGVMFSVGLVYGLMLNDKQANCQCKQPNRITAEMQLDDESRGLLKKLIDRLERRREEGDRGDAGQEPVGLEVGQ